VGKDEPRAAIGSGIVRVGDVMEFGEMMRGRNERRVLGGPREIGDVAGAVKEIPAVALWRALDFGPVKVQQIGGLLAEEASQRKDAPV